jgi:Phosphoenolpyruvate carboxykinase
MNAFNLREHELTVEEVHRNLAPSALYEHAILYEKDAHIAENGALVAYSGVKTGRSPKDKRVVKQEPSENEVWWGHVNIPLESQAFAINRERARDYLNSRERLYCFDGFAGWDTKYRMKVRVICSRPYHALFMHTMLIRPTRQELEEFGAPDFVIYNAGAFRRTGLPPGWAQNQCRPQPGRQGACDSRDRIRPGDEKRGLHCSELLLTQTWGSFHALFGDCRHEHCAFLTSLWTQRHRENHALRRPEALSHWR